MYGGGGGGGGSLPFQIAVSLYLLYQQVCVGVCRGEPSLPDCCVPLSPVSAGVCVWEGGGGGGGGVDDTCAMSGSQYHSQTL